MRTRNEYSRELLLEVERNGFRRLIYRTVLLSGREVFVEESDLPDCSRTEMEEGGFPVHFSMRDAWTAITAYTSPEGLMARQVWHEGGTEWVALNPVFIHDDLRPLVQRSLSQVTRDAALNQTVTASIGQWLRALTQQRSYVNTGLFTESNTYRHAS